MGGREIKFRCWKKAHLRTSGKGWQETPIAWRMFYGDDIREFNDFESIKLNKWLKDKDGEIWMQYTGLKDGKGRDIYEGDIIRPKLSVKDMTKAMLGECIENYSIEKFEVCWGEGCFELYDADNMYAGDLKQVYDGCEVLGNIYENPKLLKGDKHGK